MPIRRRFQSTGFRAVHFFRLALLQLTLVALAAPAIAAAPLPVIFDTDMDSDCDDAGALAILHALADRGEVRILATTVSARHRWSGPCVDAINTYFGRPDIPIGIPPATPNRQGSKYAETIAKEFPHDFPSDGERPDAATVYRRVLAAQPDGSVTLVTVGDLTNVRDLLASKPDSISPLDGVELARTKVKCWFCMGSRYPADRDPARWGNFKMDPQATVEAISLWPRPIVFTGGGEFARALSTGARLKELPPDNPVRRVYELYFGGEAKDRHSADLITVMVAARGTGAPWKLVTQGHNHIFKNGTHEWRETPDDPNQSYVSMLQPGTDPDAVAAEMEELMLHLPDPAPKNAEQSPDRSFLSPPQIISTSPGPEYQADRRKFQGIPSLARSPQGRLWAVWYASRSGGEDQNNYVVVYTSGDDGRTWLGPALVIDPDRKGPVRAFDPQVWLDPAGRLWVLWAQATGHDGSVAGVWAVTTKTPDVAEPQWSAPRRLTDGIMMGKPTVLSTGEWVLPASTWRTTDHSARAVVSTDRGETWVLRGGCQVPPKMRQFDEHMIVERRDGSLWMLIRSNTGFLLESTSSDRGRTWTLAQPSAIKHPSARFFIRRLASGRLLLVKHHKTDGRRRLTALLSDDDGKTWSDGLLLDERGTISYPDGVQADDGRIFIIYDRNRTRDCEILMAVFTEADVAAGKPGAQTRLRVLVNRGKGM